VRLPLTKEPVGRSTEGRWAHELPIDGGRGSETIGWRAWSYGRRSGGDTRRALMSTTRIERSMISSSYDGRPFNAKEIEAS